MTRNKEEKGDKWNPSAPPATTGAQGRAVSTTPDIEPYRCHMEESGMTHAQETEYLRTLWLIMNSFVDLGIGVETIPYYLPELGDFYTDSAEKMLPVKNNHHQADKETTA